MSNENQVVEIQEQGADRISSLSLITNSESMKNVSSLAKLMASSKVTVPKHLQGSEGDCLAIIIQASNWGMNPFAVAQKTHLVNGVLGYEAQLVNAVVQTSGAIQGGFNYEYQGDGNNLSCRVGAVIKGQSEITWGEYLRSADVSTKNSPLWKTNPKQQLGYLQVKNWARLYCPAAILGVYTDDELQTVPAEEKDITQQASEVKPAKAIVSDDVFNENIGKWRDMVKVKGKSPEWLITFIESKGILTDEQKEVIKSWSVTIVENEVQQANPNDDFLNEMNQAESAGQ
jgi:hypothetical protein